MIIEKTLPLKTKTKNMKNLKTLAIAVICLISTAVSAQKSYTRNDVFSTDRIIWFGIDYSFVKMKGEYAKPGDPLYKSPAQIVEDFFESTNTIIVSEPGKYNIKKTFDKKMVENDVMIIEKRNKKVDPIGLVIHNDYKVDKEKVQEAIKEYKSFTNKEGIGVVFFAECLNHEQNVATYYVTFFDIASNQVLLCEEVSGKPSGAGMRNYWAGAMVDALGDAKKLYKSWK
jgi:hypothetical protein